MRIVIGVFVAALVGSVAQASAQDKAVAAAFDHYEQIRVALSADTLAAVAQHAAMLAEIAEKVGGAAAKASAEGLTKATSLDDARAHFSDLSIVMVPKFQAEKIPGASAYICPMKQKPWMQRGDTIANPYFGKAMSACGSPLESPRK